MCVVSDPAAALHAHAVKVRSSRHVWTECLPLLHVHGVVEPGVHAGTPEAHCALPSPLPPHAAKDAAQTRPASAERDHELDLRCESPTQEEGYRSHELQRQFR